MVNTQETHADFIKKLKDSNEADAYFSSVLRKCKSLDKDEADALIYEALKNLAQARPQDVNINVNDKHSLTMRALLRFLRFIARNLMQYSE